MKNIVSVIIFSCSLLFACRQNDSQLKPDKLSIAGFTYHEIKTDSGVIYEPYISKLLKIDAKGNFNLTAIDNKITQHYVGSFPQVVVDQWADTLLAVHMDKKSSYLNDILKSDQFIIEGQFDDHIERMEISLRSIKLQMVSSLINDAMSRMNKDIKEIGLTKKEEKYWFILFKNSNLIKLPKQKSKIDTKMQIKTKSDLVL